MGGLPTVRAGELGHGGGVGAELEEGQFGRIARGRVAGGGDLDPDLGADHAAGSAAHEDRCVFGQGPRSHVVGEARGASAATGGGRYRCGRSA